MLVWLNGPFGGGKTQTAFELHRRLPGSVVCDPEHVGYGLQRMAPPALRPDFQEFRAWRSGVVEVLDRVLTEQRGVVVAPMTLVVPEYFEEIIGTLRRLGHEVHHVALLADRDVVLHRLRSRVVGRAVARWTQHRPMPRAESWAVQHLDRFLDALGAPLFATQLRTDDLSVPAVAERVAGDAGLTLTARPGPVRSRQELVTTSLRHLRLC